jgi:hypothetical protein
LFEQPYPGDGFAENGPAAATGGRFWSGHPDFLS